MPDDRIEAMPGRRLLLGAAAASLGSLAVSGGPASAELLSRGAPGYYRFPFGDALVTVVSDGRVSSGDPYKTFRGAPAEIDAALSANYLAPDRVVLEENVVALEDGGRLTLFDCGVGTSLLFGRSGGRLLGNLRAAGIAPERVGAVVLSHGHPDHVGALMDDAGRPNFPNALIYLPEAEYAFWSDPTRTGTALASFHELFMRQVGSNRDRLQLISREGELLPGVRAVESPGHTIGHMHFELSSAAQVMAYTADVTRHHVLGLEHRWEFVGDFDPKLSIETRDAVLARYADERMPILSYHYPWPGLGHVVRFGDAFRYVPTPMDLT